MHCVDNSNALTHHTGSILEKIYVIHVDRSSRQINNHLDIYNPFTKQQEWSRIKNVCRLLKKVNQNNKNKKKEQNECCSKKIITPKG